jgi:pimeloyl-ACP methyl ester carboxylesterase
MAIFLIPPVCGLAPPVYDGFNDMKRLLQSAADRIYIVEFPGQGNTIGQFSLANSCVALEEQVHCIARPEDAVLFGVCSGALAALWTACRRPVRAVVCWEMSERYCITRTGALALARKYRLRLDWTTLFIPIYPLTLVERCSTPLTFGYSMKSRSTTEQEQRRLAMAAPWGQMVELAGTSHFPGHPAGSASLLAGLIQEALDRTALQSEISSQSSKTSRPGKIIRGRDRAAHSPR